MASGPQRSTTREPRSKKPTRGSLTFHGILVGFFWRERMSSPKLWGIITKTLAFNWIWVIITNNGGILIFELVVEPTLFLALSQSLLQRLLAWWLNQPSWKIWVKMASSSPIFGVKIKKYLKPPPSIGFCYNPPYNSWVGCHPPQKKKNYTIRGLFFIAQINWWFTKRCCSLLVELPSLFPSVLYDCVGIFVQNLRGVHGYTPNN